MGPTAPREAGKTALESKHVDPHRKTEPGRMHSKTMVVGSVANCRDALDRWRCCVYLVKPNSFKSLNGCKFRKRIQNGPQFFSGWPVNHQDAGHNLLRTGPFHVQIAVSAFLFLPPNCCCFLI